ncbi:MAG TPA: PilZ domain-containing protein [Spirochaetota bacterium]|nr:PilZ domain-containing protein [Spirochaetota bacterium]HOM38771.1 PilZ domain-containing protein [Spirochaetota bacterium]HPQ49569.1 PilZ domain-containing protein [Spirochaetota bacterium]
MNIILMTKNEMLKKVLIHKLLVEGINIINLNTIDEVEASIPVRARIAIIDDDDIKDIKEILKKAREIKINKDKSTSRLILVTKINDNFVLKSLFNIGFDLVLQNSLHPDTIAEKIHIFVSNIVNQEHQNRRYIRVKPDNNEEATIRILSKNNQYLTGRITDISLGGIATKFNQDISNDFAIKDTFTSIQINIGDKNIIADVSVVKTGGDMVAFLFLKMRDSFKTLLAEYIFEKIQKNLDLLQ